MTSTVIFWDQDEEPIQPYNYIQIGVLKEQINSPSRAMEATVEKLDLQEIANKKY